MSVITRFAPSPTGDLHIGSARTALFNYLYARAKGGQFLLRVEDTDRKRSTPEATQAILEGLNWLGLEPDQPPVFQFERAKRHADCALEMVENGTAFRCYTTPEELLTRREEGQAKRAAAKQDGLSDTERATLLADANRLLAPYRSPWRDGGDPPEKNAPFTIRLRAPNEGAMHIDDLVQGRVTIEAREIDDLILLRADGTPTYMLAVVVDDHDMGVTHIIRGDDHLRNAFRQIPIYQAMGWAIPEFAHLPLIHGPDGKKLSKRHGATSTLAYRDMGYLPEAMNAYLMRLGWSHGNQEIFTMQDAIAVFDLEAIGKSPSRLDFDKLGDTNAHFIRSCEDARLLRLLKPFLEAAGPVDEAGLSRVTIALPEMKDRGKTLPDLVQSLRFLTVGRPLDMNKKARKSLRGGGLERLAKLRPLLAGAESWHRTVLSQIITLYCSAQELSMGQVGQPLRAALTGGLPAPDIAPVLEWLGREEALSRIDDQIERAAFTSEA